MCLFVSQHGERCFLPGQVCLRQSKCKGAPIAYAVVGEHRFRDLSFSKHQHVDGGAHLLFSLAVLPSLSPKEGR